MIKFCDLRKQGVLFYSGQGGGCVSENGFFPEFDVFRDYEKSRGLKKKREDEKSVFPGNRVKRGAARQAVRNGGSE